MQSFEALNPRAVAVVVDPIQSVKGKVVIDAFRYAQQRVSTLSIQNVKGKVAIDAFRYVQQMVFTSFHLEREGERGYQRFQVCPAEGFYFFPSRA